MADDKTQIIAALKKSGFPLQTRVRYEIDARPMQWTLAAVEHPWRPPEGRDEFIDLVAYCATVVLVIECKKAEERSLVFLRPVGAASTGTVTDATVLQAGGNSLVRLELQPSSYRAEFCVSVSDKRLLEAEGRLVVLAADAVATPRDRLQLPDPSFLVPVIVTTAQLYTVRFQPTEIALETGYFGNELDHERIEPISWIRFHKSLTSSSSTERTVLIVNAVALPAFLDAISNSQK